jgi:hypothetical protein
LPVALALEERPLDMVLSDKLGEPRRNVRLSASDSPS